MTLSLQEVARLADLARIELTEEELELLAPQLDVILDAVKSVADVADKDIKPTSHAIDMTNVFRADTVHESWPRKAMLAGAPDVENGQFRVPQILSEES